MIRLRTRGFDSHPPRHLRVAFYLLRYVLLSTLFLFALLMSCLGAGSVPVGVREESRCCHLSVGLEDQSRLAVIGTRYRRNEQTSSSFKRQRHRTACTVPGWSRVDGAGLQACELRQQQPCSWPACHLCLRDEDPTAEAPNPYRAVGGYGSNTRSANFG